MILTVTLNPSVDISYKLDELSIDTVNRVSDISKTAGGKGLNVARVLHQLEEDVSVSGFLGGALGNFIHEQMNALQIEDLFVPIAGETRNCIAIIHDGKQTEMLEGGPSITAEESSLFLEKFEEYVQRVSLVTISGSLPAGLATDFYQKLLDIAHKYDTPVLLDANGSLLKSTLLSEHKPLLIKPNEEEVADLLGKQSLTEAEIIASLNEQLFEDIPWIVVTLGAEGAIVKHLDTIYRVKAPKIDAVNPVGSGDSVVAGFAAGLSRKISNDEDLIKFGLAMGVLNALEEKTGQINPEKITWAVENMQVEKVK